MRTAFIQPSLFQESGTIEERFRKWISVRPEIYEAFKRAALYRVKHLGKRRIGGKEIVERMRMDKRFNKYADDPYRINNTYTALLVRKLLSDCPYLIPFIETRKRKTL